MRNPAWRSASCGASTSGAWRWKCGSATATASGSPTACSGRGDITRRPDCCSKFTADVVTLVLIRGSNLDAPVNQGGMNLTDRGLQRHRVTWVREMDEEELRTVGEGGPTIDGIEIAEFESQEQLTEWLKMNAPAFVR